MARITIIIGLLLCGLSAVALVTAPIKMPASFIPMMFGIPVLFCGVVGLNPHRRRMSVAIAATIMAAAVVAATARCGYGIALSTELVDHPDGKLVVPNLDGMPAREITTEMIDRHASKLAACTLILSLVYVLAYLVFWLRNCRRDRTIRRGAIKPSPGTDQPDDRSNPVRAELSDSIATLDVTPPESQTASSDYAAASDYSSGDGAPGERSQHRQAGPASGSSRNSLLSSNDP